MQCTDGFWSARCDAARRLPDLRRQSAVVIGGSMAGLLAARVLSDHFQQVLVVERDGGLNEAEPRKGVPQGRHAHALLATGARVLEELFPGFSDELVGQGALLADPGTQSQVWLEGAWLTPCDAGLFTLAATRPLIESHVRARVLQRSNVSQIAGRHAYGLRIERGAVVALQTRDSASGLKQDLPAELVVDASGRGSRLPRWLSEAGFAAPEEEGSELDLGYATCMVERDLEARHPRAIVISPHSDNPRGGLALPVEGGRWIITLAGYEGDHPPTDADGFRQFAASLPSPALAALLRDVPHDAKLERFHYRRSLRRRYERLSRMPRGVLAVGDALCSFNPVYAQGMSVAALEAQALDRCLARSSGEGLTRAFFCSAAKLLDVPWHIVGAADRRFIRQREAPLLGRLAGAYVVRVQRAGARDPSVARTLLEVMHLVAPARAMFAPSLLISACRYGDTQIGR